MPLFARDWSSRGRGPLEISRGVSCRAHATWRYPIGAFLAFFVGAIALESVSPHFALAVESHPGLEAEATYAEALVA
ncbi:MAG: hypothetical protein RJB38_135, partial [Pseudomonadota bacterium]